MKLMVCHGYFIKQIHPDLRDLMDTMNSLSALPEDFEGKVKVNHW